ncbi:uncharacterized protein CLAFUR5_13816 [Fulvia fulva]|uniref:DUF7598 domain-containing protein n=1 Tax=Passalora fulva TaxID=5499 RepID=A0A9Q8PLR5_PASFU|nr:uncharacterized protein CLAFUR5_13816 [Fulvia fulva]UJO24755.1 hypothetical protein CLAFUR5_13816 [Fulvia fulva]WPV36672.1 hypothetical protein CLAFUW7_13986 [Fulvia fulva]
MFLRLYPTDKLVYIPFESRRIELLLSKCERSKDESNEKTEGMALSQKSLAGPGYIILNGIRVANVIAFLAVITASVVMLVKIDTDTHLFFFDAVSHVITLVTSMFLIVSELSLFRGYFARNWPLLSPSHGFVTLALAMIVLGINVMGNLNKPSGSQEELGMAFWRIVIASGILIFILGWFNLLASFIFRSRKQNITARQVRAHGAVAVHKTPVPSEHGSMTPPAPVLAQSYISNPITPSPTKANNPFEFMSSSERRTPTLPSYHTAASSTASPTKTYVEEERPTSPTSRYSRVTACTKKKVFGGTPWFRSSRQSLAPPLPVNTYTQPQREMEISAPMGVNPQFAHLVQRPDSALHPSRTGESQAFRWRV